jgi:hypothetical protein
MALAILVSVTAILDSAYRFYETYKRGEHTKERYLALINQTPLFAQDVVIEPHATINSQISVSFKLYKSGDIFVESGSKRELIDFPFADNDRGLGFLVSSAYGADEWFVIVDGTKFAAENIKYIESQKLIDPNKIEETKTFENGAVETKVIDIKSNETLELKRSKITLTPDQQREISEKGFKRTTFQADKKSGDS